MKKMLLPLFALCLALNGWSQGFHFHHDPDTHVEFTLPTANAIVEMKNYMLNQNSGSATIRWTRTVVQITQGWVVQFCDKNNCYTNGLATRTFDLAPADTGLLKPQILHNNIEGCLIYKLDLVSETANFPLQKSLLFTSRSSNGCSTVGNDEIVEIKDFAIAPNPTADVLNVVFKDSNFRGRIEVADLLGSVLMQQNASSDIEKVDVSNLAAGTYLLRAFDENGRAIAAKRFSKL